MSSGSSTRARAVPPLGSWRGEPYELPCALGVTGHAQIVRSIRALGSIDPRVSLRPERACIHASAGIDPSIPALPSAPRACPSIQVRTWIHRSPRVSPWKCAYPSNQVRVSLSSKGIDGPIPASPSMQVRASSPPRACPSIQVRLSLDPSVLVRRSSPAVRPIDRLPAHLVPPIFLQIDLVAGQYQVRRRRAAWRFAEAPRHEESREDNGTRRI